MRLESPLGEAGPELERVLGRGLMFADSFARAAAVGMAELTRSSIRATLGPVAAATPRQVNLCVSSGDGTAFYPCSFRISARSRTEESTLHPMGAILSVTAAFDPEFVFFVLDALLGGRHGAETGDRARERSPAGRLDRALSPLESEMMARLDRILAESVSGAARTAFGMSFDAEDSNGAGNLAGNGHSATGIALYAQIDISEGGSVGTIALTVDMPASLGVYERPSFYPSPAGVRLALRPVYGFVDVDAGQWGRLVPGDVLRIIPPRQGESPMELRLGILRSRIDRRGATLGASLLRSTGLDATLGLRALTFHDTSVDRDQAIAGRALGHRDCVMDACISGAGFGTDLKASLILDSGLIASLVASADLDPDPAGSDPFAELCVGEFCQAWTIAFLGIFHCGTNAADFRVDARKGTIHGLSGRYFRYIFDVDAGKQGGGRLVWLVEEAAMDWLLPRGAVAGPDVILSYGDYAGVSSRSDRGDFPGIAPSDPERSVELRVMDGSVMLTRGAPERAGKDKGLSLVSFGAVKYTGLFRGGCVIA